LLGFSDRNEARKKKKEKNDEFPKLQNGTVSNSALDSVSNLNQYMQVFAD
jgi:hypothetical protein